MAIRKQTADMTQGRSPLAYDADNEVDQAALPPHVFPRPPTFKPTQTYADYEDTLLQICGFGNLWQRLVCGRCPADERASLIYDPGPPACLNDF